MNKAVVRALLFLLIVGVLPAQQTEPPEQAAGEDLTVKIAIMGPGDQLFFWFGHISLVIDDAYADESRFFNYGLFSFRNKRFIRNFIFGRMIYSSGVISSERGISRYISTNRSVTLYTLDIPPENREKVLAAAERSILPENREYLYHNFNNNCCLPHIVELIDLAADGQFRERYGSAPGRFTIRQHCRRHTWFSPFAAWFYDFIMGQGTDVPITVWQEMFLPSEVGRNILDFQYTDTNGVTRPLVSNVGKVYEAYDRPEVLDVPPKHWPLSLAFGLVLAAIACFLFYLQYKSPRRGQAALGVCHSLFGFIFGAMGSLLFFVSLFTGHDYTWNNANLLFINPLLLAAVPLGILYAKSHNDKKRSRVKLALGFLWLLAVAGILVSMLIKLLPWFWQDNLGAQLLVLPIALALSFTVLFRRRSLRACRT
jgi:hypothetical protein